MKQSGAKTRTHPAVTIAFLAAAFPLAMPASARAADTADLRGLLDETVVTTASKSVQTGTNAPATSTTLTADDMRRYGIRTVDEAINFLALGVSSSNPLYTPDVAARGVGIGGDRGDHVLLLIDGHTMNDALFGSARFGRGLGVPIELIDHIEVILGPGSVLYGSSAMLAVINVVTKRAKDYAGTHVTAESELGLSYRGGVSAGYAFTLFDAPGEIVTGVEFFKSKGPSFTFGPQDIGTNPFTGQNWRFQREGPATGVWGGVATKTPYTEVPSAYLSLRLGDFQLRAQASTFKLAAPFRARHIQDGGDFDDPDSYQIDRAVRGDLSWNRRLSQLFSLKARAYVDSFDNRQHTDVSEFLGCRFPGVRTCRYRGLGVTQWGGAELQASFDWLLDGRQVTLAGLDGRWRYVQGKGDAFDYDTGALLGPSTSVFKRTGPTLGPYVQHVFQPAMWFGMNAGARVDYDPRFDPVVSPRLAATTKPWSGGALKAVYAEAFRAPSFVESDTSSIVQLPAQNLVPERVRSIEASLEQRTGSQRWLFGVFRSWWSNLIEPHVLTAEEKAEEVRKGTIDITFSSGAVTQYRNVSTIENYGFNSSYEGSAVGGRLRYAANVTGAIARRVAEGVAVPLTIVPGIFGNARVSYDLQGGLPVLALSGHFMGRRIADRAWDGGFAVYPVAPPQVELRATVLGPVPLIPGLSYRFSANYVWGDRGPYVVGFRQGGNDLFRDVGELVPVDTFRMTLGLQYDFFR